MKTILTTFFALVVSATAFAADSAAIAIPTNDEVIVLERYNVSSPFWTETEHIDKTALGRVLVDSSGDEAVVPQTRGFDEIYESGPAKLRPKYTTLESWLKIVTRPYFTLIRAKETEQFYFALFVAGRNRLAFCFYEKNPSEDKFYFACAVDAKGNLLTDYAGLLYLGRSYAAERAGVYFVDANKKPVMMDQRYGLRFIEGILLPYAPSATGEMTATLKATTVGQFDRDRKSVGQADAILNMPDVFAVKLTPRK